MYIIWIKISKERYILEHLYDKYGRKKIYIILSLILIVLNIIMAAVIYQAKIRFSIDGLKFKYISQKENSILFKDNKGDNAIISIDSSVQSYTHSSIGAKYKIEYKDKVILVDSSDLIKSGEVITLSDGSHYTRQFITVEVGSSDDKYSSLPFDVQLVNNVNKVYAFIKDTGIFSVLILTIPLIFLGIGSLIYPEKVWRFQHCLSVSGGEPTEWAIFSNKVGGAFLIGLAVVLPIIAANM